MISFSNEKEWQVQFEYLRKFLEFWYGKFSEVDGINIEKIDCILIPGPLRSLYELVGNRSDITSSINTLLNPSKLTIVNDLIMFYTESQGVYNWYTSNKEDNPSVFGAYHGTQKPFKLEEENLCGFLYQLCLFEAIGGAKYGGLKSWCSSAEIDQLLSNFEAAPLGCWRWPEFPTKFFYSENAIAITFPNEDGFTFQFGSISFDKINDLEGLVENDWDYIGEA